MSATTLIRHDERNTDSDSSEEDDDTRNTSKSFNGVADPIAVVLPPAVPSSGPNFIIGDSRSSSLDSDDVSSSPWVTDFQLQQQRQRQQCQCHEGPHLFRSIAGRPASAVDWMSVLRRQSRVDDDDDDDETPTSGDDDDTGLSVTSGTTPKRLLARPRCDDAAPSIVADFRTIADGVDKSGGTVAMTTVRRIGGNLGKLEVVQGPNAPHTLMQVWNDAVHKIRTDIPARLNTIAHREIIGIETCP